MKAAPRPWSTPRIGIIGKNERLGNLPNLLKKAGAEPLKLGGGGGKGNTGAKGHGHVTVPGGLDALVVCPGICSHGAHASATSWAREKKGRTLVVSNGKAAIVRALQERGILLKPPSKGEQAVLGAVEALGGGAPVNEVAERLGISGGAAYSRIQGLFKVGLLLRHRKGQRAVAFFMVAGTVPPPEDDVLRRYEESLVRYPKGYVNPSTPEKVAEALARAKANIAARGARDEEPPPGFPPPTPSTDPQAERAMNAANRLLAGYREGELQAEIDLYREELEKVQARLTETTDRELTAIALSDELGRQVADKTKEIKTFHDLLRSANQKLSEAGQRADKFANGFLDGVRFAAKHPGASPELIEELMAYFTKE